MRELLLVALSIASVSAFAETAGGAGRPLTVLGAGDLFMAREFPSDYKVPERLRAWIGSADVRLINFEMVVNDGSCPPNAWSGGTWAVMPPSVLTDFVKFGFNGCGCANNHSLDYSREGLMQTRLALKCLGLPFAGIGRDLQEATAAAFVDTPNGRVAFVAMNCEFHRDAQAGWTTSRSPGRPGMNFLRHKTKYLVTASQLQALKEISAATGIDGVRNLDQKDGYIPPDPPGYASFGWNDFWVGERTGKLTWCDSNDLARITAEISRARDKADCVVVLAHSHDVRGERHDEPDFYFMDFCRAAIDAGATVVFGGGTHQLRGIEFRDGKPIFYSLGDFVFQNSYTMSVPPDFCERHKVPLDSPAEVALNARSKGGKLGLHTDRANFLSVLPRLTVVKGKVVRVEMLPVELGFRAKGFHNGLPVVADAETSDYIRERLAELSRPFGTTIGKTDGGTLVATP